MGEKLCLTENILKIMPQKHKCHFLYAKWNFLLKCNHHTKTDIKVLCGILYILQKNRSCNILRHMWLYTCSPLDRHREGAVTGSIWSLRSKVVQCPTRQPTEATWSARGVAVKRVSIHGLGPCEVLQRALALHPGECCSPSVTLHRYTHVLWRTGHYIEQMEYSMSQVSCQNVMLFI